MKVLDFEVNEKTVKDIAFLDGDTYIITLRGKASRYIDDYYTDCFKEVWLCVLYDMSQFDLFVTWYGKPEEYQHIEWYPSERLMEQIEKFVA